MAQPDGIPKQKNIIRIDTKKVPGRQGGGTHGWQVKFEFNLLKISKFFSDIKYGGVLPALDAAISFRDSYETDTYASRSKKPESTVVQKGSQKSKKKGSGSLSEPLSDQEKQVTENKFGKKPPFSQTNPELLLEWDYEKNVGIDPDSPPDGRSTRVGWKCLKNPAHKWDSLISNRTRGKGCPYCAGQLTIPSESVAALRPELMSEWHPTKNEGIDPFKLGLGSQTRIWWLCSEGHEWSTLLFTRTRDDKGCQKCKGTVAGENNSLASSYPAIAEEWHPTKNGELTPSTVTFKSGKMVWWKCKTCLNEWHALIKNRTHLNSACPICSRDNAVITYKQNQLDKLDDFLPDYEYDAQDRLFLNFEEIQSIFRHHLKIESESKSIESLFAPRNLHKIKYDPYYQRNYVWDKDKATYFIESILIGTEIPPLIFYESEQGYEVIDGRQRFETIKKFHNNEIQLTKSGLHVLKPLAKKTFSELSAALREMFYDTKIRIVTFTVVEQSRFADKLQDMLKKEIFRRYNSGITPLRRVEIEKAIYIRDEPTHYFKKHFLKNEFIYQAYLSLFFADKMSDKLDKDFVLEKAVQQVRLLLVLSEMPVISTRQKKLVDQFYDFYSEKLQDVQAVYKNFLTKIKLLIDVKTYFETQGMQGNRYFYECLYWALSVLEKENIDLQMFLQSENLNELVALFKQNASVFLAPVQSMFFYKEFVARYTIMAKYLEQKHNICLSTYIRQSKSEHFLLHEETVNDDDIDVLNEKALLRIEKSEAIPYTIDDICRLMLRGRFIVRPVYQRGEVINKAKSSAIIESMLLGIKLPPLYLYKRMDNILEVLDGQQRLLSILGYIGQTFLDESGQHVKSAKHEFGLSNLQILSEYNGKTYKELPINLQNKLLDSSLSLIIIEEKFNPTFEPVDLFIRLNNKPYPIKENTFEMWNSYVDKDIIDAIKALAKRYDKWFYVRKNNVRMHNEELLVMIAYLEFNYSYEKANGNTDYPQLDIFQRDTTINVRIKQKSNVTKLLNDVSIKTEQKEKFVKSIKAVDSLIQKVRTILIDRHIDTDQQDDFLEQELTSMLNVSNKPYYVRKYQDIYALWFLVHFINLEMLNKERIQIKSELHKLFGQMKGGRSTVQKESADFLDVVKAFRDKFIVDSRQITLSVLEKQKLISLQSNICPICKGPLFIQDEIEIDHINPLAVGGKDRFLNLQATHKICNRKKGVKVL